MNKPFFSIITPTYNRANIIGKTVESVLNQHFEDFEFIIVDDGSSDNTDEVIKSYTDDRIKYYKIPNSERGFARNFGASKAVGVYLNFLDSDDLIYPNHLAAANSYKEQFPSAGALSFSFDYFNTLGEIIGRNKTQKGLKENKIVPHFTEKVLRNANIYHLNGTFIKKDVFEKVLFIENRQFKIFEDWHFFYRLSLQTRIVGINEITNSYHIHKDSSMSNVTMESLSVALTYFDELIRENPSLKKYKACYEYEVYSMKSLISAVRKNRWEALNYLLTYARISPLNLFKLRTLGILKNIIT